jgi:hypothetical protein
MTLKVEVLKSFLTYKKRPLPSFSCDALYGLNGPIAEIAIQAKVNRVFLQGVAINALNNAGDIDILIFVADQQTETDAKGPSGQPTDGFTIFRLKIERKTDF